MRRSAFATMLVLGVVLIACGDDDDDAAETTAAVTAVSPSATPAPATVDEAAAACADGKTLTPEQLVVGTGEPALPPYVIDDTPETGRGFEAAVAYAVAGTMGFAPDQLTWSRTTPEAALQPGPKDFDVNLQQLAITGEHNFSQPYYVGNQAILGSPDSPAAVAATITDFQNLRLGAAAGTASLTFVTDVLQPATDPFVYDDVAAAKQALDNAEIDAIVADLPTALSMSAGELAGTTVFGRFPSVEGTEPEPWGLLLAQDNPLVECVNLALTALTASGQLEAITNQWMSGFIGVPELTLE
jgi:polar amino acid transport system substrate-binding protein